MTDTIKRFGNAQITISGTYVDGKFDSSQPESVLENLRDHTAAKLKAAIAEKERFEHMAIVQQATVESYTATLARYEGALQALRVDEAARRTEPASELASTDFHATPLIP